MNKKLFGLAFLLCISMGLNGAAQITTIVRADGTEIKTYDTQMLQQLTVITNPTKQGQYVPLTQVISLVGTAGRSIGYSDKELADLRKELDSAKRNILQLKRDTTDLKTSNTNLTKANKQLMRRPTLRQCILGGCIGFAAGCLAYQNKEDLKKIAIYFRRS